MNISRQGYKFYENVLKVLLNYSGVCPEKQVRQAANGQSKFT